VLIPRERWLELEADLIPHNSAPRCLASQRVPRKAALWPQGLPPDGIAPSGARR